MSKKNKKRKPIVRFTKRYSDINTKKNTKLISGDIRGIYALLKKKKKYYDVVYVGMSTNSIRRRFRDHIKDKGKL